MKLNADDRKMFLALGLAPYASAGAFALAQYLPGPFQIFVALPALIIGGAAMFFTMFLAPLLPFAVLADWFSNRSKIAQEAIIWGLVVAFAAVFIGGWIASANGGVVPGLVMNYAATGVSVLLCLRLAMWVATW
jgi:hypothetical protein